MLQDFWLRHFLLFVSNTFVCRPTFCWNCRTTWVKREKHNYCWDNCLPWVELRWIFDWRPQNNVLDVDRQNLISSSLTVDVCAIVEEIPSRHSRDMKFAAYMNNLLKCFRLCLLQVWSHKNTKIISKNWFNLDYPTRARNFSIAAPAGLDTIFPETVFVDLHLPGNLGPENNLSLQHS